MSSPEVSIIVPNYNHSKFLEKRLDSIFNQSFQDFEVILLDDASTDNSNEILEIYSKKSKVSNYIRNKVNSGSPFKQWDKGIALAKGRFIWIAESDDFADTHFLKILLNTFKKSPDLSLVYSQSHKVDFSGRVIGNWKEQTSNFTDDIFHKDFNMDGNLFIENYLIHKNVIPNVSAVLFKRESLKKITPLIYESYLRYNADWYYYIQILCNSKIGFIAEALNFFRYHNESVIANAAGESGWIKIIKMELEGRRLMLNTIKSADPKNIKNIKNEWKKGNTILFKKILRRYAIRKRLNKVLWLTWNKPNLWKTAVNHFKYF